MFGGAKSRDVNAYNAISITTLLRVLSMYTIDAFAFYKEIFGCISSRILIMICRGQTNTSLDRTYKTALLPVVSNCPSSLADQTSPLIGTLALMHTNLFLFILIFVVFIAPSFSFEVTTPDAETEKEADERDTSKYAEG